jgi:hypothetical protein
MDRFLDSSPAPAQRARALLRILRDLNLSGERIALTASTSVRIVGCRSLDESADRALVYRVRYGEVEHDLEISLEDGAEVCIRLTPLGGSGATGERRVKLVGGAEGPLTAPDLLARMDPDLVLEKEAAHFLRRVVRAAFADASAA